MAMESDKVQADCVESMEFPDLAGHYRVSGVPHTAINGGAGTMVGAAPEAYLVDQIKKALEAES
jgi:hypothetical protein